MFGVNIGLVAVRSLGNGADSVTYISTPSYMSCNCGRGMSGVAKKNESFGGPPPAPHWQLPVIGWHKYDTSSLLSHCWAFVVEHPNPWLSIENMKSSRVPSMHPKLANAPRKSSHDEGVGGKPGRCRAIVARWSRSKNPMRANHTFSPRFAVCDDACLSLVMQTPCSRWTGMLTSARI